MTEETVSKDSTRTKILAYLGQLKGDDYAFLMKMCFHLNLRAPTAKNILKVLEEESVIEKQLDPRRTTRAKYRISRARPTIPPEWSDAYGKHPYHS